jgi:FtsZ-binding cell division protein ZapB
VEVIEMRPSRAHLTGAGVGAALATVVLVSVYEGRVLTASPVGKAEIGAGQSAQLEGSRPRLVDEREARTTRAAAAAPTSANPATPTELQERNEQLAREAQRLREQVQSLQSQMQKISGDARSTKTFDLTKEELTAMAGRCELRWDTPSLDSEAPKVADKARKELGLNATERAAIDKVLAENHQQMTTQLRQLYIDVTADRKGADSLSPESLKREIEDKSSRDDLKAVYQRLARERAGLQAPPADLSTSSPLERLYRLLTGMGDRLEKSIGAQIGPDLAHRYREAGFGSRLRSSYGCP